MLEIPALGRVPRRWTLHQHSRMAARAALALLDAEHIPPAPLTSTPLDLVRVGLKRWLDRQAGKLRIFDFDLTYHDFLSPRAGMLDASSGPSVSVFLRSPGNESVNIAERVTELNRAVSGLGETALYWIDSATRHRIPVWTPAVAFETCCWLYWHGAEDEREALEEAKLNTEDPNEVEIVRRSSWDEQVPSFASQPKEQVRRERLERLAAPKRKQLSGKVARALLALIDTLNAAPIYEEHREQPVMPFAAYLWWNGTEAPMIEPRVHDDFGDLCGQSGEYLEHIEFFDHCDNEELGPQLTAWLAGLEPYFSFVRALDDLIVLLAARPRRLAEVFRGY